MKEGDAVEWTGVSRTHYGHIVSRHPNGGWLVLLNNGKVIVADDDSLRHEKE